MGLIFKGNPPSFSGNIKVEVPSATYSGESSANSATSINPYTNQGPGVAGAGLTDSEMYLIRNGQPLPLVHANLVIGTSLMNFGNTNILQDGILPIFAGSTNNSVNLYLSGNFINFTVDALTPISVFGANNTANSALTITSTDGGGITTTSAALVQGAWTTFPISIPAGAYKLTTFRDSVISEITTKNPTKDIYSAISADQIWTRPAGISSVNVKMWGAGGGGTNYSPTSGGAGGFTAGTINVTNHTTLTVKVGGRGFNGNITGLQGSGWQDGGAGFNSNFPLWGAGGSGGGGRSAIRDASNAVEIISAGGGGGGGWSFGGWTGNDTFNLGGLPFQGGDGTSDSGGGGGGFVGGLGGGGNMPGTGGQQYIGHADLSNTVAHPIVAIQHNIIINNTDPDHTGIIGKGATSSLPADIGGDGLVVISYLV